MSELEVPPIALDQLPPAEALPSAPNSHRPIHSQMNLMDEP